MSPEQMLTVTKLLNQVSPMSINEDDEGCVTLHLVTDRKINIWPDGAQIWYLHDKQHRENGPAVIWASGSQYWYLHDKLHREDGPAVIYPDGSRFWYLHGKLHREDGPAEIWTAGSQYWRLNGKHLSETEHAAASKMSASNTSHAPRTVRDAPAFKHQI